MKEDIVASYNLAYSLKLQNKDSAAIRLLEKIIKKRPDFYQAATLLGTIYEHKGALSKAKTNFELAKKYNPDNPIILTNLANIERKLGNYRKAEVLYLKSLHIDHQNKVTISNIAIFCALEENENLFFNIASRLERDQFSYLAFVIITFTHLSEKVSLLKTHLLGILKDNCHFLLKPHFSINDLISLFPVSDTAECPVTLLIRRLITIPEPEILELCNLLTSKISSRECDPDRKFLTGLQLMRQGDAREASAFMEAALKEKDILRWRLFYIDTLFWSGKLAKATHAIDNIKFRNRDLILTNESAKVLAFFSHNFKEAWSHYVFKRFDNRWDLSTLQISPSICCDPRLINCIKRAHPSLTIISDKSLEQNDIDTFDNVFYASDFASQHLNSIEDFGNGDSYLSADPFLQKKYYEKLSALPNKINIGIAWKGGNAMYKAMAVAKSLSLNDFEPLFTLKNINWINLQYGDVADEISSVEKCVTIHNFSEINPLVEIESQLALIANLDLVIQVSNASLHFSGALGTKTWAILGNPPDWRWFTKSDNTDTPWYKSVNLYRASEDQPIEELILKIRSDLELYIDKSINSHAY